MTSIADLDISDITKIIKSKGIDNSCSYDVDEISFSEYKDMCKGYRVEAAKNSRYFIYNEGSWSCVFTISYNEKFGFYVSDTYDSDDYQEYMDWLRDD